VLRERQKEGQRQKGDKQVQGSLFTVQSFKRIGRRVKTVNRDLSEKFRVQ